MKTLLKHVLINLSNASVASVESKGDDLFDKICQCPSDITLDIYSQLKKSYISVTSEDKRTRAGFQGFAAESYSKYNLDKTEETTQK